MTNKQQQTCLYIIRDTSTGPNADNSVEGTGKGSETTQQYGQGAVESTKQAAGQATKYVSDSTEKVGQNAKQHGQQAAERVKDSSQQAFDYASATANRAGKFFVLQARGSRFSLLNACIQ